MSQFILSKISIMIFSHAICNIFSWQQHIDLCNEWVTSEVRFSVRFLQKQNCVTNHKYIQFAGRNYSKTHFAKTHNNFFLFLLFSSKPQMLELSVNYGAVGMVMCVFFVFCFTYYFIYYWSLYLPLSNIITNCLNSAYVYLSVDKIL